MDKRLCEFKRLLDIMDKLRKECPWDSVQTNESLRTLTIEEVYELAEAISKENNNEIKKELGDILLHIVFYAKIGEEKIVDYARRFSFDDKGVEVFNFGKHKGRAVTDVLKAEPQYYDWMMRGDFPLHTKQKLTEIFNRTLLKN